ncbi:MAG: 4-(cytidine 5'-diphospho)-2-C-methyl-D-erythritol kinase [Rhodospirillales bacterium]|nr:4-(cytidine 5'-diphospho)-2-C-methyl-D-erythritol kinase [Rhodospirillales bacterium]
MPAGIRVGAPAKLNLYLHVTGRRAGGYHELDSLVTFTALADTLEIAPAETLDLTVTGPFADALDGGGNLAGRAAMALAERLSRPAGVRIALDKRIPVAAGLGGGSADAAAVLRGLARLWGLGAEHAGTLHETALGLGADVPVCFESRAASMAGIGEALSVPPPLPPCAVLLVNPGVPVPTGPVFAARRGPFSAASPIDEAPQDASALAALLRTRRNDLERPALEQVSEIGLVLTRLASAPGCLLARMSGSGGTCFGLFEDEVAAAGAAGAIARDHPAWWVQPTRLVHDGSAAEVVAALAEE